MARRHQTTIMHAGTAEWIMPTALSLFPRLSEADSHTPLFAAQIMIIETVLSTVGVCFCLLAASQNPQSYIITHNPPHAASQPVQQKPSPPYFQLHDPTVPVAHGEARARLSSYRTGIIRMGILYIAFATIQSFIPPMFKSS